MFRPCLGYHFGYEKNILCKFCLSPHTVRRGVRQLKERFSCRSCGKSFQINRGPKKKIPVWNHLSGQSYRTMSEVASRSATSLWRDVRKKIEEYPHCFDITRKYCERFCSILLVDGKYIRVGKHDRKIPVLYGIDYLTHDIPGYRFAPSESYASWLKFFASLKLAGYTPCVVVCDDNENIRQAANKIFPNVIIQLCHRHYLANLRRILDTRNVPKYRLFVMVIKRLLAKKRSPSELKVVAGRLVDAYRGDEAILYILADLEKRSQLLFGYMKFPRTPTTTNLIECFNSHLEGRLKTIKGFQNSHSADQWLNAYFLKRRLTPFKDCGHPFKRLNGYCSLEKTLKNIDDLAKLKTEIMHPI